MINSNFAEGGLLHRDLGESPAGKTYAFEGSRLLQMHTRERQPDLPTTERAYFQPLFPL